MVLVVKCPECNAGLKITYKKQEFEGWKRCPSCGANSYVIVRDDSHYGAKSLQSIIEGAKQKQMVAEALQIMLEKGEVYIDDLYFNIGRKVQPDIQVLEDFQVIEKIGNHYVISSELKDDVQKQIEPYLPKKRSF